MDTRAEFEAWARKRGYSIEWSDAGGVYTNSFTNDAWVAWHASRACMPATTALSQAEARVAAMEKDAERLDWLDRRNAALNKHYGTEYRWKVVLSHNVTRLMLGNFDVDLHDTEPTATGLPSCRDAIDTAIAALAE